MDDPPVVDIKFRPDGSTHVQVGTHDYRQAYVTLTPGTLASPLLPEILAALHNYAETRKRVTNRRQDEREAAFREQGG